MTKQILVSHNGTIRDVQFEDVPASEVAYIKYLHTVKKFAYAILNDGRELAIPQRALSQLLNKLKMTYSEMDWRTAAEDVTAGLEERKADLIFRVKGRSVAAVFTQEYVDIPIAWIQEQVEEALHRLGYQPKSVEIKETKHVVSMQYLLAGQIDLSQVVEGEVFQVGVLVKTSRIATCSVKVQSYLERLVCSNGMTMKYNAGASDDIPSFQVHRGKTAADKEQVVKTVQGMIKNAVEGLSDAMPNFLKNARNRFAYDNEIEKVLAAHFPKYYMKAVKEQLLESLRKDYGAALWDVYNAMTYVASHHPRCLRKTSVQQGYTDESFKAINQLMRVVDKRTKTESPAMITER